MRRGGRIKSGIPLETRTDGISGEEGRHNDLGCAEVDGEEDAEGDPSFIDDK